MLTVLSGGKFNQPERAYGAALGIVFGFIGMVYKQHPETREEIDRMAAMSDERYVLERLKQSFEPRKHIRQTIAASMMAGATLGMIAAARSGRKGEGMIAAIAFLSACVLSFTPVTTPRRGKIKAR